MQIQAEPATREVAGQQVRAVDGQRGLAHPTPPMPSIATIVVFRAAPRRAFNSSRRPVKAVMSCGRSLRTGAGLRCSSGARPWPAPPPHASAWGHDRPPRTARPPPARVERPGRRSTGTARNCSRRCHGPARAGSVRSDHAAVAATPLTPRAPLPAPPASRADLRWSEARRRGGSCVVLDAGIQREYNDHFVHKRLTRTAEGKPGRSRDQGRTGRSGGCYPPGCSPRGRRYARFLGQRQAGQSSSPSVDSSMGCGCPSRQAGHGRLPRRICRFSRRAA